MRQSFRALAAMALVAMAIFACANASAATISPTVSPTRGGINTEYAFVIRYAGNLPVERIDVFIGGTPHAMREADPADLNLTNGKDYSYVSKLPEGSHVYYFLVVDSNGTEYRTSAGVVVVDPLLDWGHSDIALMVLLFMIPLAYVMFLMRRTTKALERVAKRLELKKEESDYSVRESESPPKQG